MAIIRRKNYTPGRRAKRNTICRVRIYSASDGRRKANSVINEYTEGQEDDTLIAEPLTEEELYYYRKTAAKWYREHNVKPPANLVCVEE